MKTEYQIWSLIRVVKFDDATQITGLPKDLAIDYNEQVLHGKFATYEEARDVQLKLVVDAVYNYTEEKD